MPLITSDERSTKRTRGNVGSDDLPSQQATKYKAYVHHDHTMNSMSDHRQGPSTHSSESFGAQAPIALLGLAAIAIIALINVNAAPAVAVPPTIVASSCTDCGTVVAIRRSAHSSPVFFVEVQMLDGSTRVVQQLATGFKVGDIVQVNGNALSLRPLSS
jgi:hypothetical protein